MHATHRRRRSGLVLAMAGGLVAATAILSAPRLAGAANADADTAASGMPAQVNALTWNICGGSKNVCEGQGSPALELDKVMQRVNGDPTLTVVALQEVCEDAHANKLRGLLGSGWKVNFRAGPKMQEAQGQLNRCSLPGAEGQAGGTLVAMKVLPGTRAEQIKEADEQFRGVPNANDTSGNPTQGAACLQDTVHKLLACSSHFPNEGADAKAGTEFDSRIGCAQQYGALGTKWRSEGWRTILAGDLNLNARNSERQHLKPLYDGGNFEGDQRNSPTTPGIPGFRKKLDYVFFSDGNWKLQGAAVETSSQSDHYLVKATVRPI
jgi:hypothetical protein